MSDQEIRLAVAKACGWHFCDPGDCGCGRWHNKANTEYKDEPPNYPADLNACAEMEESLTHEELLGFDRHLSEQFQSAHYQHCVHATARQRCEAFLKCKGLWKD